MKTKRELFQVVEGIAGMWHYHLAPIGGPMTKSLCGKDTMLTHVPIDTWGFRGHLRETYCRKCEELADEAVKQEEVSDDEA